MSHMLHEKNGGNAELTKLLWSHDGHLFVTELVLLQSCRNQEAEKG